MKRFLTALAVILLLIVPSAAMADYFQITIPIAAYSQEGDADMFSHYEVLRDGVSIANNLPAGTTQHQDILTASGTVTYTIRVHAAGGLYAGQYSDHVFAPTPVGLMIQYNGPGTQPTIQWFAGDPP